ncbi:MAG: tRNA 2-thiouridine(34) synthase MnmA [Clostridia bacterium]|nr:tRNA 2-thiouridine(34) synthase MnmA [Clostridia bacterium]
MMTTNQQIAVIAMSGGVDSAVSALLLKNSLPDHMILGVTMRLYRGEGTLNQADISTVSDARAVADRIGIAHVVCDLEREFCREVIDDFCHEYREGRTPNPCVVCNKKIKFGALWDFSRAQGADIIATGHYARTETDTNGRTLIRRAADSSKDQSYVLWSLSQDVLRHVRFPLGELSKVQTRQIAAAHGFVNAQRRDSQDICFIPDGDYVSFLTRYAGMTPTEGNYLDPDGNIIGKHKGMICYTIGQRKGLGMSFGKHMFVCEKNAAQNTVTLCDDAQLYHRTVLAKQTNYIAFDRLETPLRVKAKLRYRHDAEDATLYPEDDDRVRIVFDRPQRAPALGQSAVFYSDDYLLGGGIICGAEK